MTPNYSLTSNIYTTNSLLNKHYNLSIRFLIKTPLIKTLTLLPFL